MGAQVRHLWLTAGFDFDTHILHTSVKLVFFLTPHCNLHFQSSIVLTIGLIIEHLKIRSIFMSILQDELYNVNIFYNQ
jgi:hypothetical protein